MESNSFSELSPFINVISSPYNLHLNSSVATMCESGGLSVSIPAITSDFDGDARNITTPDVGADEGSFTNIQQQDLTGPTISYTPLPNTLITTGVTLTANISDASGVPASGTGLPTLYWKINSGSYFGVTGSWSTSNAYTFAFGNGVVSGDIVSYYIVAQDSVSSPNLSAFPLTGASGFSSYPPFCSVPPTNPNTFIIQFTLSGTYTVGSGGSYSTIEAAITSLNNTGIGVGGVTFNVLAGHTETFSTPTAGILNTTGSITKPIIFQKSGTGANPLITAATGTTINSDGVIKIAGGDYITFDGIDVQENSLNTTDTTQMEWGYAIIKGSNISPTNGCQFVTVKNCSITLNKTNAATVGIYSGNHGAIGISSIFVDSTIGATNHCKISGNTISNVYTGISLNGFAASTDLSLYDLDNEISGNSISNFGGLSFIACGITTIYNGNINILNNNITGGTANNTVYGIYINTANSQNITISGNRVFNLNTSNTTDNSHVPIYCNAGNIAANNTVLVYNNLLENGTHYSTGTGKIYAIRTTSAPTNLIIRKNIIRNNSLRGSSSSSFFTGISIESNAINCKVDSNEIYGNSIASNSSASFPFYGISIFGNVLTTIMEVNSNSIYNNSINRPTSSEAFYGISNNIALPIEKYSYNSLHDNTHNGNGIMYGIYLNTATGAKSINNDSIYNFTGKSTIYGIYSTYGDTLACYNNVIFNLQTSITTGGCYGITLPTGINAANIYNNFIYGLKAPSASNADAIRAINITNTTALSNIAIYYNTIYLNAISSGANFGTSGIYHTASATSTTSSLDLRNNIIVNNSTANGTGLNVVYRRSSNFFSNFSAFSNNNLFYAGIPSSKNLIFYDGTNSDQLITSYQTRVSPRESVSVTEMPPFINTAFLPYNLHLDFNINTQAESGGQKITSPAITNDFDGDIRWGETTYAGTGTSTDIGADEIEFIMPPNDAGMTLITEPSNPTTAGIHNVKAKLRNFGANTLTNVNIQWSVNGVLQTPFPWTGNLVSGDTITSLLGNYNFAGGSSTIIKTWTNLPNGLVDGYINNDTTKMEIVVCSGPLSGIYTIGGTAANYSTINIALQSLYYCGVSGPVIFNIYQGTYNEQLVIDTIFGASEVNTITFKSANNDSNSVIISYSPSSSNANYVVKLNGTDYIRFKHLSIVNTSQNGMGRVIELINKANFNEFSNNVIQTALSTLSTSAGIYSYNTTDDHNLISNNLITGGYYGIYLYGLGTGSKEKGNFITNNIIKDFFYYGLYLYYQDSITAIGNMISNVTNSANVTALYSYYSDNINYQKNKIHLNNTGTTYAMYIYYNNNAGGNGLIANNFISESLGTGTVCGVYNYYSMNIKYYYNSLNITAGNASSYAFYTNNGSNNELKNNSFVNTGSGYAIYAASTASISSSNYNNLYVTGTNLGYWGSAISTLTAWQAASGKDANSMSTDPDYLSTTDLHVYTSSLNNLGTSLTEVTNDIDGQPRSTTTPDIGADEFAPLPIDLGVTAIYDPQILYSQAGVNIPIKVKIKNFGADSVANFNVICKIGNASPFIKVYTSYLHANQTDSMTFANQTILAGSFEISTYISLATDGNHQNDTAKIDYFGVPIKSVPYAENFDNTVEEWFTTATGSIWEKGVPTASIINSAHSNPNVWATKLNGNYPNGNTSILYSPIFNNAVFKVDTLTFWHWVDAESNKDGGYIEYKNNMDGWDILGHIAPDTNSNNWYNGTTLNRWTGTGAGWQQSKYKISKLINISNTIQFRFVFNSDATNNNYNGWAIDDFALTLAPIPFDAGIIAINSPSASSIVGDIVTVSVTVKNFGTDILTTIPVNYQIGSGNVQTGTLLSPLNPGDTANYTFTQPYQVTNINYLICAYTSVTSDIYIQNNQYCKTVVVNSAAKDVGITEIIEPGTYATQGTSSIKVVIKNFGASTQTSIPISYQRNTLTPIDAIWTGSLASGDTVQYSFPNPMNVPSGSSFSFCVFTRLANDAYKYNDTICKSVLIGNTITVNDKSVFWLGQNRPNPTTGLTNIECSLPYAGELKFAMTNLYGQKIYTFNQQMDEGKHLITLNVNDLSAGVYYYIIELHGRRLMKKMIIYK
ncbi:MAG: T9SS type A sorting domain-containing protein [Bacteroidales bacterium]